MEVLIQIVQLLACLSLLVILHEFGHFLMAKLFGVRVEKFYLFFNPGFSLFKRKIGDTVYGIGWLPLGGYVKLSGMIDESLDTESMHREPQAWEFRSKPAWQRLLIMSAGVVMNLLTAMGIYALVLFHYGETYVPLQDAAMGMDFSRVAKEQGFRDGDILLSADGVPLLRYDEESLRRILNAAQVEVLRDGNKKTLSMTRRFMQDLLASKEGFASFRQPFVIQEVLSGYPAEAAGLLAGDSLIGINDTLLLAWSDFVPVLARHAGDSIRLSYSRNNRVEVAWLRLSEDGKMGVYVKPYAEIYPLKEVKYGFWESFPAGISKGFKTFTGYGSDMKLVFTKEGMESIGGFGTITGLFPTQFSWPLFWYLTAYLSVILAFMNLLPIPGLDGGHILFTLIEICTRRTFSQEFMLRVQQIGMLILLFLLLYANGMDIIRAFR